MLISSWVRSWQFKDIVGGLTQKQPRDRQCGVQPMTNRSINANSIRASPETMMHAAAAFARRRFNSDHVDRATTIPITAQIAPINAATIQESCERAYSVR